MNYFLSRTGVKYNQKKQWWKSLISYQSRRLGVGKDHSRIGLVSIPYWSRIDPVSFSYRSPIVLVSFSLPEAETIRKQYGNNTRSIYAGREDDTWWIHGGYMAETLFAISYKVVFLIDEEVGDGGDSDVAERWGLVDRWNSEACGEFERWEDHPGYPGESVHAVSAWAFQVHGKARVRTRIVRFDPQAPWPGLLQLAPSLKTQGSS